MRCLHELLSAAGAQLLVESVALRDPCIVPVLRRLCALSGCDVRFMSWDRRPMSDVELVAAYNVARGPGGARSNLRDIIYASSSSASGCSPTT